MYIRTIRSMRAKNVTKKITRTGHILTVLYSINAVKFKSSAFMKPHVEQP